MGEQRSRSNIYKRNLESFNELIGRPKLKVRDDHKL